MDIFDIKGSGENEYKVLVSPKGEDSVTISCDCRAGIFGRMCKHKLAVATGDPSLLINSDDSDRLIEIAKKIQSREIGMLFVNLEQARKDQDVAKRKYNKAKKALESAMKG